MRCPRPEARSRGQKSRDGAPCGERACRKGTSTPRGVGPAGCAARRSIPLPLQGTEGTQRRASPGPRQRIRVAERWLRLSEIGCLTIESENRERKNARAPHSAHSRPRLRGNRLQRESSTGSPLARGRAVEGASPVRVALAPSDLILRRPPKAGVSKDGHHAWPQCMASWFETRRMRGAPHHEACTIGGLRRMGPGPR